MVILNWIKGFWYRKIKYARSLKRAIQHAKIVKTQRGYKCYVLLFPGGYKAVTKAAVKSLMSSNKKYFKKGTTIQDIERMAVYITN
ncbi:MAG: hypothetical protein ACT4OJ_01215 [Bacteroidota bacterium]